MIFTYFILAIFLFFVQNRAVPLTPVEKNVTQLTPHEQFDFLFNNVTDQQKLVIGKFFANFFLHIGDKHSEEKTIRMYAELNREHPDVYIILHPAFAGVQDDFKGGESAKNFLKFYFNRIDAMRSGNDSEFNSFLNDVRAEWKKMDKNGQAEINKGFATTVQMINGE